MALSAIPDVAEPATCPEWHRWQSKRTGRWFAARTAVPADLRSSVMLISGDTYRDLLAAVVHSFSDSVRV